MKERAVSALRRTWSAIGLDVLASHGNPERVVLKAADVREAVSNCGYMGGYSASYGNDLPAVKWLESLPYDEQDAVLAEAFPDGKYGA